MRTILSLGDFNPSVKVSQRYPISKSCKGDNVWLTRPEGLNFARRTAFLL
jgi:hypothetical protein